MMTLYESEEGDLQNQKKVIYRIRRSRFSELELIERCWSQNPEDQSTFENIVNELKTDPTYILHITSIKMNS